jgi:Zn-dependent alcohol dehydrogenase
MLTKDKVKESINKMPDSFTIDELIEQLITIEKIEQGILHSNDGKVISNNEMQQIIEKWSS